MKHEASLQSDSLTRSATRKIYLFFSSRFTKNIEWVERVLSSETGTRCSCRAVDIEKDNHLWSRLNLRSVPTAVVFEGDKAISNHTGYLSLNQLETLFDAQDEELDGVSLSRKPMKRVVPISIPYSVTNSSGTHRYERWNEQSLKFNRDGIGWTAPSRRERQLEFLEFEFESEIVLSSIWLKPRKRTDGVPSWKSFPKAFSLSAQLSGGWQKIWEGNSAALDRCDEYICLTLGEPVQTSAVRLEIAESHRIGEKAFPGFAGVSFCGEQVAKSKRHSRVVSETLLEHYGSEMVKHGIAAEEEFSLECINLRRGQTLPKSYSSRSKLLIVRDGCVAAAVEDDPIRRMSTGSIMSVFPNSVWSITGEADQSSVLVLFATDDLNSIWEAR